MTGLGVTMRARDSAGRGGILEGRHILVLEDEPIILLNVARALERCGVTVRRARSVGKALANLADSDVDGAILDVNMGPGATCLPVAEYLQTRDIPFCLYSGDMKGAGEFVSSVRAPLIEKPASDRTIVEGVARLFEDPTAA